MTQNRLSDSLGVIRQLTEVARQLTGLMRDYPAEILRGGIRHAAAVQRYHITAQAIGVSREDADRTLAESRRDLAEWPWWFDSIDDAEQRLKLGVGTAASRPPSEVRQAARERLAWLGERYTPADVDALAIRLQAGLTQ